MRARQRAQILAALIAALGAFGTIAACEDSAEQLIFFARRFNPSETCLGPHEALTSYVVREPRRDCAPTCLTFGDALFVTTSCPPFPPAATVEASDAGACRDALVAFENENTCGEEAPDASDDAGSEDDASADAGSEGDASDAGSEGDASAPDAGDAGSDA